jgi:uncharacterized protein (DUF2384 family)
MRMAAISWKPRLERLDDAAHPETLVDVYPQLQALVESYNARVVAHMLGIDPAQVSRWLKRDAPISDVMATRIFAAHTLIARAHQVFTPPNVAAWLFGHEPLLGGARPIDVLVLRGLGPVLAALDGVEDGVYA